jgi:hypothetical protein
MFSNTLSLLSSRNVSDQVSHPYKTTGKIADIACIKLISKNQQLSKLLFADDQGTIADTEDNLQKAAYKLNQIITEYRLTISVQKTKWMPFKGRDPVGTEIANR